VQAVRIFAIRMEGPAGLESCAPSKLALFVNKSGLDFDSAATEAATQTIDLSANPQADLGLLSLPASFLRTLPLISKPFLAAYHSP